MNRWNGNGTHRHTWLGTALAVGLLVGTGCTTMRMKPPADLTAASDEFAVTGRSAFGGMLADESFVLGPYRVAEVDRDWTHANRHGAGEDEVGYQSTDSRTGFGFRFSEGEEALPAQCSQSTHESGYNFGKSALSSSATDLLCTCGVGEAASRLELGTARKGPAGRVTLARGTYEVHAVHEVDGAWNVSAPAGYRVGKPGEPLGGVEVLRPGRVWLAKGLDAGERRQLACLLAGLMLFQEPSEH